MTLTSQEGAFLEFCRKHPTGVADEVAGRELQLTQTARMEIVNSLLAKNLVFMRSAPGGRQIHYHAFTAAEVVQLQGLSAEDHRVYQLIKLAGNSGIWTKDLRIAAQLQQAQANKSLKVLASRKLIKDVKSVENKTRKLYMQYDLEPSAKVNGGIFHTNGDLDVPFVQEMTKACFAFLCRKSFGSDKSTEPIDPNGFATATEITAFINGSGICTVPLQAPDTEQILKTLVYDGKIEEFPAAYAPRALEKRGSLSSSAGLQDGLASQRRYRALRSRLTTNAFTSIPCGHCPVFNQCSTSGPITPSNCEYFQSWLGGF